MSADIVSEGTMDRVAAALLALSPPGVIGDAFTPLAVGGTGQDFAAETGQSWGDRLYHMNQRAVFTRYEGRHGSAEKVVGYVYQPGTSLVTINSSDVGGLYPLIQMYKAIDTYLYQCSEDDVFESELFNRVAAVRNKIACFLVDASKDYAAEPWGYERPSPMRFRLPKPATDTRPADPGYSPELRADGQPADRAARIRANAARLLGATPAADRSNDQEPY